jgi:protein gp37
MGLTKIQWTQRSWNPVVGCTRVSEGCRFCYAEAFAGRLAAMAADRRRAHQNPGRLANYEQVVRAGKPIFGHSIAHWTGRIELVPEALDEPLKVKRPSRWFVCSMSDLCHEKVPREYIIKVFRIMERCPQHTFQVLTKRPEVLVDVLGGSSGAGLDVPPLPNVWLGTSVEDQKAAEQRVPRLLECPAAVYWISAEPLLGPLDVTPWLLRPPSARRLGWVVCGGESWPGRRWMRPEWARSLRDQCAHVGVPFFFKQWGTIDGDGNVVRKKPDVALLDGVAHQEYPECGHKP